MLLVDRRVLRLVSCMPACVTNHVQVEKNARLPARVLIMTVKPTVTALVVREVLRLPVRVVTDIGEVSVTLINVREMEDAELHLAHATLVRLRSRLIVASLEEESHAQVVGGRLLHVHAKRGASKQTAVAMDHLARLVNLVQVAPSYMLGCVTNCVLLDTSEQQHAHVKRDQL